MGRHGATHQSRTSGGAGAGMLIENVFEPRPCHRSAFGVDEDLRDTDGSANSQPGPEVSDGFFPKWKGPLLAALSADTNARGPVQSDLLQLKFHQFGDTQPAGETKMQHGAI